MQAEADTTAYEMEISSIQLHVFIGRLNQETVRNIETKWPKNEILYHYKEMLVTEVHIAKDTTFFQSSNLTVTCQVPTRIFCAFVKRTSYVGNRKENPFDFRRARYIYFFLPGIQVLK
jgi:hypothetical protein